MMQDVLCRMIHITDLHLFSDENQTLLGVKTQRTFELILNLILKEKPKPDLILIGGDISQDGSEESYRRVARMLTVLNIPVYCTSGNHDNRAVMEEIYPLCNISLEPHILLKEWQIILLNSQKEESVEGELSFSQLNFLEKCLRDYPNHKAIILMHHHPVMIHSKWLDNLGLMNADPFWQQLKNHSNVHTILFGHVHQWYEGKKNHIQYYSTPSTCFQFQKESPVFQVDKMPPAYRYIELHPNEKLITSVKFLTGYVQNFDMNALGY